LARGALTRLNSDRARRPLYIGLTGGPGVGKSTVAKLMSRAGASVIDADAIGHWLLANDPTVIKNAEKLFGNAVLGQRGPDRALIGSIVFNDNAALQAFNRIIHPPLLRRLRTEMKQAATKKNAKAVVVDAALIFEWGIADWFDLVVVVAASRALRMERLRRAGLTLAQAKNRFASQLDQRDKIALADYAIRNDGERAALKNEVRKFIEQISQISRSQ